MQDMNCDFRFILDRLDCKPGSEILSHALSCHIVWSSLPVYLCLTDSFLKSSTPVHCSVSQERRAPQDSLQQGLWHATLSGSCLCIRGLRHTSPTTAVVLLRLLGNSRTTAGNKIVGRGLTKSKDSSRRYNLGCGFMVSMLTSFQQENKSKISHWCCTTAHALCYQLL